MSPQEVRARRHSGDLDDALVHDIERDIRAAHLATIGRPADERDAAGVVARSGEWSMLAEWRGPLDAKYGRSNVDAVILDARSADPGFFPEGMAYPHMMSQAEKDAATRIPASGSPLHMLSLRESTNPAVPKLVAGRVSPQERAERHVRQAYAKLRAEEGRPDWAEWVSITRLRQELSARGMSREEQDRTLHEMAIAEGVSIVPESNQKALTEADRAAAIVIGNQNKHLISIFGGNWRAALRDNPPPMPAQVAAERRARQTAGREAKRARLNAMTIPQLRDLARRVGLSPGGRKADLVGNLMAYEGPIDVAVGRG